MRDFALRNEAIPFLGQIAGYNRNDQSDFDITQANSLGDLYGLANGDPSNPSGDGVPKKNNLIRVLKPQFVSMTAAYLTLGITSANDETSRKFYVTVGTGYTTSDGIFPATPTDDEIIRIHTMIKGDSAPYDTPNGLVGTITLNKLDILRALPKFGDANYRGDCFVVGVHFLNTPSSNTGYKLNKFEVNCAGVITNG